MLTLFHQKYYSTTSCPCPDYKKTLQMQYKILVTLDIIIFSYVSPFKHFLIMCIISYMLEGSGKFEKNVLAMGVTIGGDAEKLAKTLMGKVN